MSNCPSSVSLYPIVRLRNVYLLKGVNPANCICWGGKANLIFGLTAPITGELYNLSYRYFRSLAVTNVSLFSKNIPLPLAV